MVWSGRLGCPDVNGNDLINHQKRRRAGHYGLMDGDVPHDGDKPEGVTFVERRFGADQILQRHDRHQERIGVAHPVEAIIFEAGNGSVVALEERVELARLAKTQFGSAQSVDFLIADQWWKGQFAAPSSRRAAGCPWPDR